MYWVNMHDKFMSGWGEAAHGRSILCIECDTLAQANAIERAAQDRPEMKRISISDKPRRCRAGDHSSYKHFKDLGGHWLDYVRDFAS